MSPAAPGQHPLSCRRLREGFTASKRKRRAEKKGPNVSIQPLGMQQNVWELDLQRGSRWGELQLLPASRAWVSLGMWGGRSAGGSPGAGGAVGVGSVRQPSPHSQRVWIWSSSAPGQDVCVFVGAGL